MRRVRWTGEGTRSQGSSWWQLALTRWWEPRIRVTAAETASRGLGVGTFLMLNWLDVWPAVCKEWVGQAHERDHVPLFIPEACVSMPRREPRVWALEPCPSLPFLTGSVWCRRSQLQSEKSTTDSYFFVVEWSQMTNCSGLFFLHWAAVLFWQQIQRLEL